MTQSLNADVYDVTGKVTGSFELPAELFDVEVQRLVGQFASCV